MDYAIDTIIYFRFPSCNLYKNSLKIIHLVTKIYFNLRKIGWKKHEDAGK